MISKKRSRWLWIVGLVTVSSLSGCEMYPSKPGQWPGGVWGSLLQIIAKVMDFFANHVGLGYGIALLIVTVLIRLLILPLMVKQIRYSKVMQQMQPRIKEIQQKYKGDSQKIQQETMKLWQETGVNPMSGCLPTVIQLPVLYALFGAIKGDPGLNNATFLWIFHLGQPDHFYILPVVAAITTYLSSRVMMTGTDTQSRMMLIIMPIFVLMIGARFASGLALYWIYTNIFTAIQTYFIRVRPAQAEALAKAGGGAGGTPPKAKMVDVEGKVEDSDGKGTEKSNKSSKSSKRGSSK